MIKVLEKEGFRIIRQQGSHIVIMNTKNNRSVIPMHPGKEIKPGLTRAILKESGISREEFQSFLKKKCFK